MRRQAFTLIEVAVAGSLIGLVVATTLAIIPAGLKAQHQARMRAVAAVTVVTLFQSQNYWTQTVPAVINFRKKIAVRHPIIDPLAYPLPVLSADADDPQFVLEYVSNPNLTFANDPVGITSQSLTNWSGPSNLTQLNLKWKFCLKNNSTLTGLNGNMSNDLSSRLVFAFSDTDGSLEPRKYIIVWECTSNPRGSAPGQLIELATFNYYDEFPL